MIELLKQFAPTVASVLLGPMAGLAVAGLGKIFGLEGATIDTISKVVTDGKMTPDQLSEITRLELQFKNDEAERGFRYADLEFKDRDSARNRDIALAQAGQRNYRADVMFVLSVVVISWLVWITWKDPSINEYVKGIFTLVLGRFLGYLDVIYSFEFGSTRAGARKTELLANAAPPK